jgi:hypothetical protein
MFGLLIAAATSKIMPTSSPLSSHILPSLSSIAQPVPLPMSHSAGVREGPQAGWLRRWHNSNVEEWAPPYGRPNNPPSGQGGSCQLPLRPQNEVRYPSMMNRPPASFRSLPKPTIAQKPLLPKLWKGPLPSSFDRLPLHLKEPLDVIYQFNVIAKQIRQEAYKMSLPSLSEPSAFHEKFYSDDLKLAAAHLFLSQDKMKLIDVAILLHIHPTFLQHWVRFAEQA